MRSVIVALSAAVLPALGCGSTEPARFYSLEAVPEAALPAADSGSLAVDVGPVVLSEGLDRPQMVTRLGPNEVALHDYSRWAEPLEDNVARVLAEDLSVALGSQRIGTVPGAETREESWRVTVNVLRFEAGADGQSLLVARWRLFKPGSMTPSLTRKSAFSTPLAANDAAAVAAALSADINSLAGEISAALQGR